MKLPASREVWSQEKITVRAAPAGLAPDCSPPGYMKYEPCINATVDSIYRRIGRFSLVNFADQGEIVAQRLSAGCVKRTIAERDAFHAPYIIAIQPEAACLRLFFNPYVFSIEGRQKTTATLGAHTAYS